MANQHQWADGRNRKGRLVLFLLSPRVIDMDTYLPVAMELKATEPSLDVRFVTFSTQNRDFIMRNGTLMEGVRRSGGLWCLGGRNARGWIGRQLTRAVGFARLCGWLLSRPRAVLIFGFPFHTMPYALWYALARLRGGKGIVVNKSRAPDEARNASESARLRALRQQDRPSLVARLLGRDADAFVDFHDRQELFGYGILRANTMPAERRATMGLPNLLPEWVKLVEQEVATERERLRADGCDVGGEIFTFMPTKSFSSRGLRTPTSADDTCLSVLTALRRVKPDALILVRPHPLALGEPGLQRALAAVGERQVRVSFAHPEVLTALSRRVLFNAPSNVMSTGTVGRFVDCSDYKPDHFERLGQVSVAYGYGNLYVSPLGDDFPERLRAALDDDTLFDVPGLCDKRNDMIRRFQPNLAVLRQLMDSP